MSLDMRMCGKHPRVGFGGDPNPFLIEIQRTGVIPLVPGLAERTRPTAIGQRELVVAYMTMPTPFRAGEPLADEHHVRAVPLSLVLHLQPEDAETHIADNPRQFVVGKHAMDIQIFQADEGVHLANLGRQLVQTIASRISNLGVQGGQGVLGFEVAFGLTRLGRLNVPGQQTGIKRSVAVQPELRHLQQDQPSAHLLLLEHIGLPR